MNENKISNIDVIKGLANLTQLSLSDNQIKDVSALTGLKKLDMLFIGTNQISDADLQALEKALPNCNIYVDLKVNIYDR